MNNQRNQRKNLRRQRRIELGTQKRSPLGWTILWLIMAVFTIWTMFPIFWAVITS